MAVFPAADLSTRRACFTAGSEIMKLQSALTFLFWGAETDKTNMPPDKLQVISAAACRSSCDVLAVILSLARLIFLPKLSKNSNSAVAPAMSCGRTPFQATDNVMVGRARTGKPLCATLSVIGQFFAPLGTRQV